MYPTHFRLVSSIVLSAVYFIANESTINYPTWGLRNTVLFSPVGLRMLVIRHVALNCRCWLSRGGNPLPMSDFPASGQQGA